MFNDIVVQLSAFISLIALGFAIGSVIVSISKYREKKKKAKESVYLVTVHCDGKHPYLTDGLHDYYTHDVEVKVSASDWSDAAKKAQWMVAIDSQIYAWSYKTIKVVKS